MLIQAALGEQKTSGHMAIKTSNGFGDDSDEL
jgi:hypothetical protein